MDSQDLREPAAARPSRRPRSASIKQNPEEVKDYLSVSVTSKAFNIYVVRKGTADVASFALTNTGASSTSGVVLVFPSGTTGSVTITWVLCAGIYSLTSQVVTFSPVSSNKQTLQLSAPTTVSSDASGAPFTVTFTSGGSHDPQIIVTPIGGGIPQSKRLKLKAKGKPSPKAKAKPVAAKGKAKAPAKRGGAARSSCRAR
jgi:hypothetical protein